MRNAIKGMRTFHFKDPFIKNKITEHFWFIFLVKPHTKNTPALTWQVFLYPILEVEFCEIPLLSSSEALLQYLGISKSLVTLVIGLFPILTAPAA
jgi:hypothetical protein